MILGIIWFIYVAFIFKFDSNGNVEDTPVNTLFAFILIGAWLELCLEILHVVKLFSNLG